MSKDAARRLIFCPRCDARQEVSRVTKSTSCPGCHRNILTSDVEINEYCAKIEMWTAGVVTVGKKGTLIAEVRAESVVVKGGEIYLHLPNGAARSKLTNQYFDSTLKTVSSGRNWNTVTTLLEMMKD